MGLRVEEYETSDQLDSVSRPILDGEREIGDVILYENGKAAGYSFQYQNDTMLPVFDILNARERDRFEEPMCIASYNGKEIVGSLKEIDAKVPWTEVEMLYIEDKWNSVPFQAQMIDSDSGEITVAMDERDSEILDFWTGILEGLESSPEGLSFAYEKAFDGAEESFEEEYGRRIS